MKTVKLESIAEIIAGQSPPSDTYNQNGDGLPFFQGKADFGETFPIARYWCKMPTKIALPDDILMSVRAPVGPVNVCNLESCIGRGLSAIRVNKNHSNKYVYYFLKVNEKQIEKLGVGSTFKAITQKEIKALNISIPEKLEDQIRIATILSKAETLIKQRKESINLLDEFLKSTFSKFFGDPVSGKVYPRTEFRNVCKVRQGLQIPISERKPEPGINRYPYITNQFINGGKIGEFIENPKPNVVCKEDDVLMTRTGNTGIVVTDIAGVFHNNFFLIDYDRTIINKKYLVSYLKLPQIKSIILKKASTTTIPDLNHGDFYKVTIPLPPIEKQNQFAFITEKTETLKTQCQNNLQELENLFASLSKKAFKGKLDLSKMEVFYDEVNYSIENDTTFKNSFETAKIKVKAIKDKKVKNKDNSNTNPQKNETNAGQKFNDKVVIISEENNDTLDKINWESTSVTKIAKFIRNKYWNIKEGKSFNFSAEMLYQFLVSIFGNSILYYTTKQLIVKKNISEDNTLKSFIDSALFDADFPIKFEQEFYNSITENFNLELLESDFEIIKSREKEKWSGIYFKIV